MTGEPDDVDSMVEPVVPSRHRWLIDFASCNYLGLDLDREVIEAIPAYLDRWGIHPSWSRMLGSPALYRQIETRLTELLGSGDSLLLPTLTHIHASVIPVLDSDGTIFVDSRAHKTIWDGCVAARAHGATVVRYAHDDPDALERLLRRHPKPPRLVCMDGVNSMTGNPPQLAPSSSWPGPATPCCTLTTPTGSGWWGSGTGRSPAPTAAAATGSCATWARATSTWCSPAASPRPTRRCWPSWPVRPSSSGCSRSPPRRTCTPGRRRSPRWPACSSASRSTRPGGRAAGHPVVQDPAHPGPPGEAGGLHPEPLRLPDRRGALADPDDLARAGRFLLDRGIYVTLAFYPGVPREEVGFRIQVTAANTDDEVTELLAALDRLADVVPLRGS